MDGGDGTSLKFTCSQQQQGDGGDSQQQCWAGIVADRLMHIENNSVTDNDSGPSKSLNKDSADVKPTGAGDSAQAITTDLIGLHLISQVTIGPKPRRGGAVCSLDASVPPAYSDDGVDDESVSESRRSRCVQTTDSEEKGEASGTTLEQRGDGDGVRPLRRRWPKKTGTATRPRPRWSRKISVISDQRICSRMISYKEVNSNVDDVFLC